MLWHLISVYENVKKDDSYQIQVMGKEYNVIFLMLNLFKWFCLREKLVIFISTKASISSQNTHFFICNSIRTASENKISCPNIPLAKHYRKVSLALYAYKK